MSKVSDLIDGLFASRPAKRWRLRVDGKDQFFRSYQDALAANPTLTGVEYQRWSVDELVAGRWFNKAFGVRSWPAPLTGLVAMGVPVNPRSLANDPALVAS